MQMKNQVFAAFNHFFDAVYVLTLQRAGDRQRRVEKELAGLKYQFFYGVDKHHLDMDQVMKDGIYDDVSHQKLKRTHRSMSLGEVACALSHRAIYQDIVDNGYQKALILEDDVQPNLHCNHHFRESLATLPKDWDLLMLGYYSEKYPSLYSKLQIKTYELYHHLRIANWEKVDPRFIRKMAMSSLNQHWLKIGKLVGGHAYAVTQKACSAFIELQTPVVLQADRVFSHQALLHGMKAYAIKEKVFGLSEMANSSYIEYPTMLEKVKTLAYKN